jgi:hypothetical protein
MHRRIPIAFVLGAVLLACEDQPGGLAPESGAAAHAPAVFSAAAGSQIAQLRRLIAPFHDFQRASDAGWSAQITPCLVAADLPSQPGSGAMGLHFGNLAYIQDGGVVDLLQPELLLYEPEKNGKLRFVGVEYIVSFADHPATDPAPTLLGHEFSQVPEFGVWGFHIYVGRHNPSGIFAAWNPKVSCENGSIQQAAGKHRH